MIIVTKKNVCKQDLSIITARLQSDNLDFSVTEKDDGRVVVIANGVRKNYDVDSLKTYAFVEKVVRTDEPYYLTARALDGKNATVKVAGQSFGKEFQFIAGPCSVEDEKSIIELAISLKSAGATMLRGGAFKPRTSPYSYQGLGKDGLKYLVKAGKETGLPVVSELLGINELDLFCDVDLIQIGARNMQNYELLREVGKTDKPVLLKRGQSATLTELLLSAEYILAEGNKNVVLCERGIRTFDTETRNTLDISAVPALKEKTFLPVIVDPSHATGTANLVFPMALASTAAGADGVMLEVHQNPHTALSDGAQAITVCEFEKIVSKIKSINKILR